MTQTFWMAAILLVSALEAGLLLGVMAIFQKVMNDFDEQSFKFFVTKMAYHAKRSPYALAISLLTTIAAVIYWIVYRLDNLWFSAGLAVWILGSVVGKITNEPVYRKVPEVPSDHTEELREYRRKLQSGNRLRALITLLSVILMVIGFWGIVS